MAEFIPRPRIPEGLQQQLLQMKAQQFDPIAAAIEKIGSAFGNALAQRGMQQKKVEGDLRPIIAQAMMDGRLNTGFNLNEAAPAPGSFGPAIPQGQGPVAPNGIDTAALYAAMGGRGGGPPGISKGR